MSSAAVVIGTLRINCAFTSKFGTQQPFFDTFKAKKALAGIPNIYQKKMCSKSSCMYCQNDRLLTVYIGH